MSHHATKGASRPQFAVRRADLPLRNQCLHPLAQGHLHMVLPRILERSPRKVVVMHPGILLKVQASFRDQHVDMGVEVDRRTEGVHDHDDPGDEPPFSAPRQHGFPRRRKQDVQQFPVPEEDVPECVRDGEHDVAVGNVHELRDGFFHPVIGGHLAAGGTEPRLAGVGNHPLHFRVCGTAVQVVSCLERIAAGEHLVHLLDDARSQPIAVLREEERPVILENSLERVRASQCFDHRTGQYTLQRVVQESIDKVPKA